MTFRLVDKPVEDVGDGPADEGSVGHELPVDSMKDRLQVVTLTRILGIKQLHELEAEPLVNVLLSRFGIDFRAHNEAEEEFISDLEVWPGRLEDGLVFLGIKVVGGGGESTADVGGNHGHEVGHDGLGEDLLTCGGVDVVDQLEQCLTFHVLPTLVRSRIIKRKDHPTQLQLQLEKLLPLIGRSIPQRGQFPQRRGRTAHLGQSLITHRSGRYCRWCSHSGIDGAGGNGSGFHVVRDGFLGGLGDGEGLAVLAFGGGVDGAGFGCIGWGGYGGRWCCGGGFALLFLENVLDGCVYARYVVWLAMREFAVALF